MGVDGWGEIEKKPVALLSATLGEIELFLGGAMVVEEEGSIDGVPFYSGTCGGHGVVVAVTGVGIRRARRGTNIIIARFKPRMVLSAGLSGALSPELRVGQVVLGEYVVSRLKGERKEFAKVGLGGLRSLEPEGAVISGGILTESGFVHEPRRKRSLFEETGVLCVDMESWGVVEAAAGAGVPVVSMRAVSDESTEKLPDVGAFYAKGGGFSVTKAAGYFLRHPRSIYPYYRFRRVNCPKAGEALKQAIEAFILSLP